jgi:hypothetical protein
MECLREYALRKNYLIERGSIESLEVGEDWGPFCGVAVCTLCKILPLCVRAVPAYATEYFFYGCGTTGDMQCMVPDIITKLHKWGMGHICAQRVTFF